jgi:hypothetical protein
MMREPAGLGTKLLISLTRPRGGVFGTLAPLFETKADGAGRVVPRG